MSEQEIKDIREMIEFWRKRLDVVIVGSNEYFLYKQWIATLEKSLAMVPVVTAARAFLRDDLLIDEKLYDYVDNLDMAFAKLDEVSK